MITAARFNQIWEMLYIQVHQAVSNKDNKQTDYWVKHLNKFNEACEGKVILSDGTII